MWQTIDSAPRDGSRVMLFIPSFAEEDRQAFGYFLTEQTLRYGVSVFTRECWMLANQRTVEPTHWMEIPADPEITP